MAQDLTRGSWVNDDGSGRNEWAVAFTDILNLSGISLDDELARLRLNATLEVWASFCNLS